MSADKKWGFIFSACGAIAALVTTGSILIGGGLGLIEYMDQGDIAEKQRLKEIQLIEYDQKKEVYYALSDFALEVAHSRTLEEAKEKAHQFTIFYYGRAHIFLLDGDVSEGKIDFYNELNKALEIGEFPSQALKDEAFNLTMDIQRELRVKELFKPEIKEEGEY